MNHKITTAHYTIRLDQLLQSKNYCTVNDAPFFAKLGIKADRDGFSKLCIPYWQRDYDWGGDLISHFFENISATFSRNDDDQPLRLGTIVLGQLIQTNDPQYEKNEFLVIDGQQRLRTLCFLFSKAQSLFTRLQGDQLKLPLYYGVGNEREDIWDVKNLDKYLLSPEQKEAFSEENLVKLPLSNRTLAGYCHLIEVHVIVTCFEYHGRQSNDNVFDRSMSRLFSRINLQSQPLNDVDIVKAQLIFQMRRLAMHEEANVLAHQWEVARALLRTRSEATKQIIESLLTQKSLLSDFNDPDFEKAFKGLPRSTRETQQIQFSRYLLLVKAFSDENKTKLTHTDPEDFLQSQGKLWKTFEPLFSTNTNQERIELLRADLRQFVTALKVINEIFLTWRPFLLLSRHQLTKDIIPAEEDIDYRDKIKWRFLRFQCFLASSSNSDRVWLENATLLLILRELASSSRVSTSSSKVIQTVLTKAQRKIFEKLGSSIVGKSKDQHDVLTARDWFLWQVLFEPIDNNDCFVVATAAMNTMLTSYPKLFKEPHNYEVDGCRFLIALRSHVKHANKLASSTGAEEIEHWISLQRGKPLDPRVQQRCDTTENLAHIANGTNQSLRDNPVLNKAGLISGDWWPTLQFLAAVTLELSNSSAILRNQTKPRSVNQFLDALKLFWSEVGKSYHPPEQ